MNPAIKALAPRSLHGNQLAQLMRELGDAHPDQVAQLLKVNPRTVWRWLADESCPWPMLAALWHETPAGRHAAALDVGNELAIHRGLAGAFEAENKILRSRMARLVAIADTGAANDALLDVPAAAQGQIHLQIVKELERFATMGAAPGRALWVG